MPIASVRATAEECRRSPTADKYDTLSATAFSESRFGTGNIVLACELEKLDRQWIGHLIAFGQETLPGNVDDSHFLQMQCAVILILLIYFHFLEFLLIEFEFRTTFF